MKLLAAVIIVGVVIWYLDFMSPEKKRKRKENIEAYAKSYEEKIAQSKDDSFKKGKSIGRAISKFFGKSSIIHK